MMNWSSKPGGVRKTDVTDLEGKTLSGASCGTSDEAVATDVERFVAWLHRQRNARALAAITHKRVKLYALYDAHNAGQMDDLLAALEDEDLDPLVTAWEAEGAIDTYVRQVRRFIPAKKRFPSSRFSRKALATFLAELAQDRVFRDGATRPATLATRQRYKAALSVFAGWLVERDVLPHNPLFDISLTKGKKRSKARKPAPKHLRPDQYHRLIDAATGDFRVLFSLLYATGMEISAALAATREDVNESRRTVWAHGGKNSYRDRECAVEPWAWERIAKHARTKFPGERLFTMSPIVAYLEHSRLLKALGYPHMRMHNTRHSFAIAARRRGEIDQWIGAQLGHAPTSTQVANTYGAFVADPVGDRKREAK
jgi:integrase